MESEWTEYVRKCRWCGRRFRLSRAAWEAAREDAPEQDEDETLAEFDTCLSCTLGVEDPDEIID